MHSFMHFLNENYTAVTSFSNICEHGNAKGTGNGILVLCNKKYHEWLGGEILISITAPQGEVITNC